MGNFGQLLVDSRPYSAPPGRMAQTGIQKGSRSDASSALKHLSHSHTHWLPPLCATPTLYLVLVGRSTVWPVTIIPFNMCGWDGHHALNIHDHVVTATVLRICRP